MVIVVNDGGAAHMYWRNRVRWCIIIVNGDIFGLRRPLGCIGGQDGLGADSRIPHMGWFLVSIRVIQWHGRWWARLLENLFAEEDMCSNLMAWSLSGAASWTSSMAAVSWWVASKMQSVAVTTGMGRA